MYINTTEKQISINVRDEKTGRPVKMIFIPGIPLDADTDLIMQARKQAPVVQHYFTTGAIKKAGSVASSGEVPPDNEAPLSTKEFMLEALQKSGVEEFVKLDKRNSEAGIKAAYDKLIAGDFETEESE